MPRDGDLLILRESEYRRGDGAILVTVAAIGDTCEEAGVRWVSVKAHQQRWTDEPAVRFIEVRAASVLDAKRRVWGRAAVPVEGLITRREPVTAPLSTAGAVSGMRRRGE
ncbi:hypothetical protein GCM10010123_41150 [Pilimelia anulata]|uniref:Uncharacterized protein n=1 Tax=Pilimelia anulata TaxID=53371 RepID=A0A8J3BE25_9ACTN|nr:hypothetical protein [Pilimelia anulata]GGK07107.1 hypothetical protein GCM10010123_41150 [Pilimelia anulata]